MSVLVRQLRERALLASFALVAAGCGSNGSMNDDDGGALVGDGGEVADAGPSTPTAVRWRPPLRLFAPNRVELDSFNSHSWADTLDPAIHRGSFSYTPDRKTEGTNAYSIVAPLTPLQPNQAPELNTVAFWTRLPTPEDWRPYSFMSFDVYMDGAPVVPAEVHLRVKNRAGQSGYVVLILGWQLFQWENIQMTLPLRGNTYSSAPIPDEVLADVIELELRITRYDDGAFGPPLSQLTFHVDNLRLDGSRAWDMFDGPALSWHGEDSQVTCGVSNKRTYEESAGALLMQWSNKPNAACSTRSLAATPVQLPDVDTIEARMFSMQSGVPVSLRVTDGTNTYTTAPVMTQGDGQWHLARWPFTPSASELNRSAIEGIAVVVVGNAQPSGEISVDDLSATRAGTSPAGFTGYPGYRQNVLAWRDPAAAKTTVVRFRTDMAPTSITDGELACTVPAELETTSGCVHLGVTPGQTYYYAAFSQDGSATSAASTTTVSQDLLRVSTANGTYELGFSKSNGALLYVQDLVVNHTISLGSANEPTWSIVTDNEDDLASLDSTAFSNVDPAAAFTFTESPLVLKYAYDKAGKKLSLELRVEAVTNSVDTVQFKVAITNQTGHAIRTVAFPRAVSFDRRAVNRVLLPVQEGLVLLKQFFMEGRSTDLTRPPLFADALAVDSEEGQLGVYVVQDSRYHAELLPNHDANKPVFQPGNLGISTIGELGHFKIDQVTLIPNGKSWTSPSVRMLVGRDFRALAAAYRHDNGFDDSSRYPTLKQKLDAFGIYEQLSRSPIYTVEVSKMVEWLKAPSGEVFKRIKDVWLQALPHPSVIHMTHWQLGRDGHSDPRENHKLEDDFPDAQPIWWAKYGSQQDLLDLLAAAKQRDFLTMPFTNWSVWNKLESNGEIAPLASTPAASRRLRGPEHPFFEYKGYVVKPWHNDVHATDDALLDTYTKTYPMDLLFVDQTGERSWRYVLADDNVSASPAIYMQGTIDENRRLSARMPLFTEGVFDQIADSMTGYCQTLRQKFWNDILDHLGDEYVHWLPYPFAADVVHENVGFYQHDLNVEVFPAKSRALFTYYTAFGYNYLSDLTTHWGEDTQWIEIAAAFQQSVASRTFGHKLLDYKKLNESGTQVETSWGDPVNPLTIRTQFDPNGLGMTADVDGSKIAPDGFFARTKEKDVIAGVFQDRFNGEELKPGIHWLSWERRGNTISLHHPVGVDGQFVFDRPADWSSNDRLRIYKDLVDGSVLEVGFAKVEATKLWVYFENQDWPTGRPTRRYRLEYVP